MCGIAGIIGLAPVNDDAVDAMTTLMAHRGPDGEGIWLSNDGRACLGHRRLAILDLAQRASQPMASADGMLHITYNGEIYNYVEIAARLRETGVNFRTTSDTEVILEAYRTWGERCVEHFNGMFAFAIHDRRRRVLFCARDRFGEKPFLFAEGTGFFAFASEYKALLALEGVAHGIDAGALVRFLERPADGLDHRRETVFTGIRQILPAEKLVLQLDDLSWRTDTYWKPSTETAQDPLPASDAAEAFKDLLTDAVGIRLRSDVTVGSCLSGGLDSSAIVCLARRIHGTDYPYHVFTGRFPGSDADEGAWAEPVIRETGAIAHETFPEAEGLQNEIAEFSWLNELPVSSGSQYAQWCVFRRAARENVTVLLDGQGADEILGGYEQYFGPYLHSLEREGIATADEEAAIRARYPMALSVADQAWKNRLPLAVRSQLARFLGKGSNLLFGVVPELAAESARGTRRSSEPKGLKDALRTDACQGFLTTLLRYGDRNSMAHSREVRLPFCDHRIAEFVFAQSERALMGEAQTKRLLREAMRGILPEKIRTRWNKQGFLPPHAAWFEAGLLETAAETFDSEAFRSRGIWEPQWWRAMAGRFKEGDKHLAATLWKPLAAEWWFEGFVARAATQPRHPALRHEAA